MDYYVKVSRVPSSPTLPGGKKQPPRFDIASLYEEGPAPVSLSPEGSIEQPLDEKLRKAYFWITNSAIITPFYDIEYNEAPPREFLIGDNKSRITLPTQQSFSSFVLLPLLTLVTRRRCLFIGGPGRGKTASAILMALLAGYPLKEVKRAIQHGQPQMTVSDLLGNPIPSDLMKAENMDDIRIAWRKWLGMGVKIIDEYNRIPTRTQSALLTVMSDNYAEIMDQIYECPEAAWYLTANDDAGGGTYQVIEALKDRIDVVVRALHFNTRFIGELLSRVEAGYQPEKMVPPEIVFSEKELDLMHKAILRVSLPDSLLRRLEYFTSQFELLESAGVQLEYKTKDNLKVSGMDMDQVAGQETGKDKLKELGTQTLNGLSVRAIMTCLVYFKAMAYFRGDQEVTFEDVRQMLPFVVHDKLVQNPNAPFFEQPGNSVYRVDKISWIRFLFDESCKEFDRLGLDKKDPVRDLSREFEKGLEGVTEEQAKLQISHIEGLLEDYAKTRKLYGPLLDDILKLKYLHQRYTNYLRWIQWKS